MNLNHIERVVAELDAWIVILSRMRPTDPQGTCHLVGCVGKGVHGPEGPHARKSDPPRYGVKRIGTTPISRLLDVAGAQVGVVEHGLRRGGYFPEQGIGCPDDFTPYQERPFCLGFPTVYPSLFGNQLYAQCSLSRSAWAKHVDTLDPATMAALVDEHKAECTNRNVRGEQ